MNFVREQDLPTITLADGQELINYSWGVNNLGRVVQSPIKLTQG